MHRKAPEGGRVIVCAPFGRDGESVAELLERDGYQVTLCARLDLVAAALDHTTGVVLVTEEALASGTEELRMTLRRQPPWSDVPFVLLAAGRRGAISSVETARLRLPDVMGNAIVLERPLGAASLTSAIASAMRSRQKQFEMRDRLAELDQSRAAVATSERELRLIADALPVLIGFVDCGLVYRFANRAYEDWFGRSPEDVVGRHVLDVAGADGLRARLPQIERALAGEPVRFELPWPRLDGTAREAEIRYIPRADENGIIDGFHVFVLDVTDRKSAERRLAEAVTARTADLEAEMANRVRAEEALRQSQKMEAVGQLTGGIAHDFNNMLTGVIGGLDIVKRRLASGRLDGIDRFMDAASASAQRAAGLTSRLLAFSRRQSLDARPIDVEALIASLEDLLRRTISEQISLRIVNGDGVPRAVADANQLESAILNLAINARDAMPDGGQLTVETSVVWLDAAYAELRPEVKPGRYVVIAISDSGVGMPPELVDKVFEPFFTTKPIGQGTGLGLSMVYGFARQSGGQVRIHSRPGDGTSVKIYLPASDADADTGDVTHSRPTPEGAGQVVLIVEDDPSVRLLIREVLSELSYTTLEAGDATAALPILASDQRIDLLVSDVGLPGMNGRQLAEHARAHRPALPILFVTGYAENAAIRAGFLGTNMGMITKPFALDELAEKVAAMIQRTEDPARTLDGEPAA